MKQIRDIVAWTLALNFLAAAGGVAWLYFDGRLDGDRLMAIAEVLYPPEAIEEAEEADEDESTEHTPSRALEELLWAESGRSAAEQVEAIQHAFDARMAMLDRRERELGDLQRQIDLAQREMSRQREALDAQRRRLREREEEAERLASDQGFQDSLELYTTMQPRQVKAIFMDLDDATVLRYVQSMPPRTAARIIREFKTPEEVERIGSVLEMMRQAQASLEER